ncbi:MAG: hypothetical protein GXO19_03860 [Epsilonproteobacteria bacterium]|nr:hypothetical protein [Campylobacterota bacterium]NPA56856.1 hypothetical protein [Campylobacterota bacterium]
MRWLLLILLLVGCSSKELKEEEVRRLLIGYFTPFSSIEIVQPLDVQVRSLKSLSSNRAVAEVCYTFRFLTSYSSLVERIKRNPNSFLARFDVGLVALLGRKFGNFSPGEIKRRCDRVELSYRYGKWVIDKI